MEIWIVEEYNELGCEEWAWEFVDAGATEADADKIIELHSGDRKLWANDFLRKRLILVKDFSKTQNQS